MVCVVKLYVRFRLVALQLDRLRHITPIDVEQTLCTLPRSLMEMYDYILRSLDSENKSAARRVMRVFEIISCASRPLTVKEVAEVFAVEFDSNNSARVLEKYRLQDPATELLRVCTSAFIRFEEVWRYGTCVYFAHASVLDYLRRSRDTAPVSDFRIDDANSAITLTKLCLCTVLSMIQPSNLERPCGPFDDYAVSSWLEETGRALLLKSVDAIKPLLDSVLLQGIERIPASLGTLSCFSYPSFASPLCCASYLGRHDYVQQILRSNSSAAGMMSSDGWTPLHVASQNGYLEIAQVFIEHGASVDSEVADGQTPLHLASHYGHLEIAQVLIAHGASVDKEEEYEQTPLCVASRNGHLGIAQVLIEHGAYVDHMDEGGETPLHAASQNGHTEIAQVLTKHGASVDEVADGQTPLHLASHYGHLGVAQVLIAHGASVDKEDEYGQTPLHVASQSGHLGIAQVLIEHGASVDNKDRFGHTPLYVASRNGHLGIAQVLIKHGASVDKEDKDPLHIASQKGPLASSSDSQLFSSQSIGYGALDYDEDDD